MNIKPTSTDSITPSPIPLVTKPPISDKHDLHEFFMKDFEPAQFQTIAAAWKSNPEIRSEVLDKARQLAADANYPTHAQMTQLAKMIVGNRSPLPPITEPPQVIGPPITEPPVSTNG